MTHYTVVSPKCCAGSPHIPRCWHLGDKLQKLISLLDIGHFLSNHGFSI